MSQEQPQSADKRTEVDTAAGARVEVDLSGVSPDPVALAHDGHQDNAVGVDAGEDPPE